MYMHVTLAVSYLFTGLAECSVGPEISRDMRKLVRTPPVIKKLYSTRWLLSGLLIMVESGNINHLNELDISGHAKLYMNITNIQRLSILIF